MEICAQRESQEKSPAQQRPVRASSIGNEKVKRGTVKVKGGDFPAKQRRSTVLMGAGKYYPTLTGDQEIKWRAVR